jgi:predicted nucleic acid-binding protein
VIIIADSSPLVALALCDCLDILDALFGEVRVSQTVYEEGVSVCRDILYGNSYGLAARLASQTCLSAARL